MYSPLICLHQFICLSFKEYTIKLMSINNKDRYVVYACGFDRNRKWEWFRESKWCCKNDVAKMMLQKWCCKKKQALATLLADGITSIINPLIFI